MNFFPWNISWNISEISRCFFRLYTHRFNIFLYVKHYLSFIYAYWSSLSLSAGLAWFACLSTGSKLGLSSDYYDITMTCVVHGTAQWRSTKWRKAMSQVRLEYCTGARTVRAPVQYSSSSQSMFGMLKRWMLLNKWTTDNIEQNTPNTNKNKQIGR